MREATRVAEGRGTDPEKRLSRFIDTFDRGHRSLIRAVRKELRKRFPTATELAYDNYNFLAFSPKRRSEALAGGKLIIRSVPAKQRPRRRSPKSGDPRCGQKLAEGG